MLSPIVNVAKPVHNGERYETVTTQTWLAEFAASGISPELARANARWVEGEAAVHEFLAAPIAKRQRVTSYLTIRNAHLRQTFDFIADGGWIAYGSTLEGKPAEVPYLKPANPRYSADRDRPIKYETPVGEQAKPILPCIPWMHGLRIAKRFKLQAEYQARYAQQQPKSGTAEDAGFWAWWLSKGCPGLIITEGLKTALAPIELGYPAIALRGITQWHPKGVSGLWPELEKLCSVCPSVVVAFDQDSKLSTRQAVEIQANQLGKAIAKVGKAPRFLTWNGAQGKGLDDALAAQPEADRGTWLKATIKAALTQKQQQREATLARARVLRNPAPLQPDRLTEGEYLPPLPKLETGAIHALLAPMNSGKTYRTGLDWVGPWRAAGGVIVALSPLNSLGQQTAQDWGLPHIHDYSTDRDSQAALRADVSHSGGIVACPNSAHRVLALIPSNRPLLLVIDEAAQTLTDAAEGGTLGSEWADRWEDIKTLKQRAAATGAIVLSEDGLDADTVALTKALSGCDRSIVIQHKKQAAPWQVQISRAPVSSWRAQLLEAAAKHGPQLVVTTSQKEARRLEKILQDQGVDVVRIDSQTNEGGRFRSFFENPDRWLQERQPQVLILSPSCKTGLSIQGGVSAEDAYFKGVWGYFPALDTDTQLQLLGRYRPNVPRYIWAPAFIQPERGEQPNRLAIANDLEKEAARYARAGGFAQAEADPDDAAIKQYLAARGARRWAGKVAPVEALQERLETSGHVVAIATAGEHDAEMAELWQVTDELIAWEDAQHRAALEIDPETHDLSWANQVLRSVDSSHENRCKAAKVKMMARFPGLNWNDSRLWFDAVFCPVTNEQRPAAPGAALWAEAEHYRELWNEDAATAQEILSQRLRAAHLLPQSGPKAALAALLRPLIEQLLKAGEIGPTAKAEQIKALALQHRDDIRRYWRLDIKPEQSAVAIACKIARKFGLTTERSHRVTVGSDRIWVYALSASATWQSLVDARETALRGAGTNPLDIVPALINKSVPPTDIRPSKAPPDGCDRDFLEPPDWPAIA
ncbi:DUF3854 domain-containing protein (plasmid) [Synechococcus elongatus PCC 11801]|uniref:DUF3854 domain-containing protein n=1 Tax=Synechococcus elongatus PCC 11801 TaxID=2219813 RepID=A0ACD5A3I7_SYNEL